MPALFTRADSLREYLTGAASDGGAQASPSLSFGGFRSSTEALSYGIQIANPLSGVLVLFASGGNPTGIGTLTAQTSTSLAWKPYGQNYGPSVFFSGTQTLIVEGPSPGQYLRITATPPFTTGNSQITLTPLADNQYGFDDVTIAQAASGISQYRATILRNEAAISNSVTSIQRCIGLLGITQVSNGGGLPASSAGTITTSGSFASWPSSGWCQVRSSTGTLKEVIYYSALTQTALTVPASGRALLGTTAVAGTVTDLLYSVPGVAIALDPGGILAYGSSIETIASATTAPAGVTWNLGITPATGIQIGTLGGNQQIGIWVWRQIPAGAVGTPSMLVSFVDSFTAF